MRALRATRNVSHILHTNTLSRRKCANVNMPGRSACTIFLFVRFFGGGSSGRTGGGVCWLRYLRFSFGRTHSHTPKHTQVCYCFVEEETSPTSTVLVCVLLNVFERLAWEVGHPEIRNGNHINGTDLARMRDVKDFGDEISCGRRRRVIAFRVHALRPGGVGFR